MGAPFCFERAFYPGGVNAELVQVNLRPARHARPTHRDIWIRLDDHWWPGRISAWLELDGRWIVTAEHERPGTGLPIQVGNYWYNREVIAPRVGDERPPDPA